MPKKTILALLLAIGLLISISGPSPASTEPSYIERPQHMPGEVLIKLKMGTSIDQIDQINKEFKTKVIRYFAFIRVYHLKLPPIMSVEDALEILQQHPLVEYIVPNSLHYLDTTTPNDPHFDQMWALRNTGQGGGTSGADINAPEAWDITTGSHDVVVAVIDSGADLDHEDLLANIWTNPGEIPDNGIDDDGNGYIDDVHGWDFSSNDNDPSPAGGGCLGHGTHTAGTIGAVGNNGIGIVGVNWNIKIMPLKTFRPFLRILCAASDANLIAAIEYYTRMGVRVSSNSWGGVGPNPAMLDAIRASNSLFVAAAGNEGRDNDAIPHYPSNYDLDNIIAVAATDRNDNLAGFSNFGLTSVDLGAPGAGILSTLPNNRYGSLSGTSMATPHVAGVAGLLLAQDTNLTINEIKWRVLNGTDNVGLPVLTAGRLNAYNALQFGLSTPDVTVGLTAVGPTDVSPGDLVSFRIEVTNNGATAINAKAVIYVRLEDGRELSTRSIPIPLGPGRTIGRRLSIRLPTNTQPGTTFRIFGQVETAASFDEAWIEYAIVPLP